MGFRVHIVANGAELTMTIDTPQKEAFLESFIDHYGVPKVVPNAA